MYYNSTYHQKVYREQGWYYKLYLVTMTCQESLLQDITYGIKCLTMQLFLWPRGSFE